MKPIFINSSPNTTSDDIAVAFKELFSPKNWQNINTDNFEKEISNYLGLNSVSFDSARSSFFAILKAWKIKEGDEVIVPAFTCTVIVNPVLWSGAKPIYVDIAKTTFNTNLENIRNSTTKKTKLILVQHTFGRPVEDIEGIVKFAHAKNIKVVEDCAHTLGLKYKGRYLGSFGDAGVITFGLTKVISGGRGGMVITDDISLILKLKEYRKTIPLFPIKKTILFIINPIIWYILTPIYYLGIGKATIGRLIIVFLQLLKIININNIVEKCEEFGSRPNWIPAKPSKSLTNLAQHQFHKLGSMNKHRRKIAKIYATQLGDKFERDHSYLRYPVYVKDKQKTLKEFRTKRIILGDWYKSILHIPETNYGKLYYTKGQCPVAEYAARHIVNLPTFIKVNKSDANFIANKIKSYI